MSIQERYQIECPYCHHNYEQALYSSVNVTLDPEMREKVLKMTIFDSFCPKCGQKHIHNIPLIYNNMEKKYMIFLGPDDWVLEHQKLIENGSMQMLTKMGYRFYGAINTDTIQERIVALDHDFDPKILEVIKIWIKLDHKEQKEKDDQILPLKGIYINEVNGEAVFDIVQVDDDGKEYSEYVEINREDYEDVAKGFMHTVSKNKDILFEGEYLKKFLDSLEVE